MPELPEVESVRRQLAPAVEGRRVLDLWADEQRRFHRVELLRGRRVERLWRRGKFLIADLDDDLQAVLHLGMTGAFRIDERDDWARATFDLDDGHTLVYRDPRRFGRIAVVEPGEYADVVPTLATLGPEPLDDAFDPDRFADGLARTRAPVKAALLGQRLVAGVGNIYTDEALWLARIDPRSRRVGRQRAHRLHAAVREVIAAAIEREGTTFRDYQMVNGQSGRNADFLEAYGQSGRPCSRCGTALRKATVAQRGTTWCPSCQR